MARAELRSIFVGLAASGFLLGCVDGSGGTTTSDAPGLSASPGARKSGNREIEAPEVFQTTDSALWDGRPSLGGIWVASPEVTDPERVVMFNPATGKADRVGIKLDGDKKIRVYKSSGQEIKA